MRQWKALMRKNFINWKRKSCCAVTEICCPAACMFLMVLLRSIIDIEVFDYSYLTKARSPSMPGLTFSQGNWTQGNLGALNADVGPFFKYSEYPQDPYYDNFTDYSVQTDPLGPLYFTPSDCMSTYSFQLPQVSMPIVAAVGEQPFNEAQTMMVDYFRNLLPYQWSKRFIINPVLR